VAVWESSREPSWQRRTMLTPTRQASPPSRLASPMRQLSPATRSASASARAPIGSINSQARMSSRVIRTASPVRAAMTVGGLGGSAVLPVGSSGGSGTYRLVSGGSGVGRSQPALISSQNLAWDEYKSAAEERDRSFDSFRSRGSKATEPVPLVPPLPLGFEPQTAATTSRLPVNTRTVPLLKRLSDLPPELSRSNAASLMAPTGQQLLSPVSAGTRMLYPPPNPPTQPVELVVGQPLAASTQVGSR
jgi:hypothetical protein